MQTILLETPIAAPIERCFLLSTSIDLHMESTSQSGERAVAGVTHGLIDAGETVTWRGRHFGFMFHHTSLITEYDRPNHFQDVMQRGMFRIFKHDHYFEAINSGTLMRDEVYFAAPLGFLGRVAEQIVLGRYMTQLLRRRNATIRNIAESKDWQKYLDTNKVRTVWKP